MCRRIGFPTRRRTTGVGSPTTCRSATRAVAANAQVTFVPVSGTSGTMSTADRIERRRPVHQRQSAQCVDANDGRRRRHDDSRRSARDAGDAAFTTLNLDLNNGGGLTMAGGIATVSGATGNQRRLRARWAWHDQCGRRRLAWSSRRSRTPALLQPQGNTAAPQTLTIHANGVDTIDLDGDSETGVVDVDNALANVKRRHGDARDRWTAGRRVRRRGTGASRSASATRSRSTKISRSSASRPIRCR